MIKNPLDRKCESIIKEFEKRASPNLISNRKLGDVRDIDNLLRILEESMRQKKRKRICRKVKFEK